MLEHALTSCSSFCCRRWDECWIRLLDGMLQLSFSDSNDYQLRIPVRVRNIVIRQPVGRPACQLLVRMDRFLGTVENDLASITGMELMAAPRRAGGNAYTCAALSASLTAPFLTPWTLGLKL